VWGWCGLCADAAHTKEKGGEFFCQGRAKKKARDASWHAKQKECLCFAVCGLVFFFARRRSTGEKDDLSWVERVGRGGRGVA
jgi:hypothetical protein